MNYCQEYFADNVNIFPETFFWHLNKKMEMPFSCFMKIKDKYIKETIDKIKEDNEDQDFFSAIKICKKKRIGPSRNENNRELFYKKDMGILARSGFDFETSKKVMDLEQEDYKRIINLLWVLIFGQIINFIFNIIFHKYKNYKSKQWDTY